MSALEVVLAAYLVVFVAATFWFMYIAHRALRGWDAALDGWEQSNELLRSGGDRR